MAPDNSSVAAGKKLMALKNWDQVARSSAALWGLCQGSKTYQVRVDFSNLGYNCNCPSRKFPCKHVLGLLMLWAASPDAVDELPEPDWVTDWLDRRKQRAAKNTFDTKSQTTKPKKPTDKKTQERRAAKRESRVSDGLARLDVWLSDLVRNGLAVLDTEPAAFWDEQAKRLVDAQAPGLASRIGRLSNVPRSSKDWPERLLTEMGRIQLILHAWNRIADLEPDMQSEVRQLLGWTIDQEELNSSGEKVEDSWAVTGQWVDDEGRVRSQRSWVIGRETNRVGLMLQFAPAGQAFAESIVAGTEQEGTIVFYPGTSGQRGKFLKRDQQVSSLRKRPPGSATIEDFLAAVADQIASGPWLQSFGAMLYDVTIVMRDEEWFIRDRAGQSIPLRGRDHWKMMAITGGHPFDLSGEWDGYGLRPLGFITDGTFRIA